MFGGQTHQGSLIYRKYIHTLAHIHTHTHSSDKLNNEGMIFLPFRSQAESDDKRKHSVTFYINHFHMSTTLASFCSRSDDLEMIKPRGAQENRPPKNSSASLNHRRASFSEHIDRHIFPQERGVTCDVTHNAYGSDDVKAKYAMQFRQK